MRRFFGSLVALVLAVPPAAVGAAAPSLELEIVHDRGTGLPSFVRAHDGLLARDDAGRIPADRARTYLSEHGDLFGMRAADVAGLELARVEADAGGGRHVHLRQTYRGLPVFAGELAVHLSREGVTALNGTFVPAIELDPSPVFSPADAARAAEAIAAAELGIRGARALEATLQVFRTGLVEGQRGEAHLAYGVEVRGDGGHEQVWIDARDGAMLAHYALDHDVRDRCVYTPRYEPDIHEEAFKVKREGDPSTGAGPVDHLYDFTGQVYDTLSRAFGRDSYDGNGVTMRTVYLVNENCPNAYWDGRTTNYCPGFDTDDIVAHEWGHAYTDYFGDLVYAYEPGALNESFSDIIGEIVDLTNDGDQLGGSNNDAPFPAGQRWLIGEDLTLNDRVHRAIGLRDMWDPERLGDPGRMRGPSYQCGTGDNGGVHVNSGVSNHAFAMLTDGKTYNNVTVTGIGLNKAAHVHWLAFAAYSTPATKYIEHAAALESACADLLGVPVNDLRTGLPGDPMTASDCEQVHNANLATQMLTGTRCRYRPVLLKAPPPVCTGAETIFAEDFEGALDGWSLGTQGRFPSWPNYAWDVRDALPDGRAGRAAFAINERRGRCDQPLEDISGQFWMDTPALIVPADDTGLTMRFDHYVETSTGNDGGNLKIRVNDGEWTLVPREAHTYNAPLSNLVGPAYLVGYSLNPKAGELAWHGFDEGETTGSWGTTVVRLSDLVAPGDTFSVRFDFGINGCGGRTGWFVDDVMVYRCPPATKDD